MSKLTDKLAVFAALAFILPFAVGIVHAAEPTPTTAEKAVPPPTIDTNRDGKPDAWDRDTNGLVDAWDTDADDKPDVFDDDGDGKPDKEKLPSSLPVKEDEPRN